MICLGGIQRNKNFWLPVGRKDDLLKNTKLTKFEAGNVEGLIEKEMIVRGVMLGGQAQEKPFLLVEVDDLLGCGGVEGVMGKVWPKVEEANRVLSKELTIERDRVVVTDMKVKALPRLGKGNRQSKGSRGAVREGDRSVTLRRGEEKWSRGAIGAVVDLTDR